MLHKKFNGFQLRWQSVKDLADRMPEVHRRVVEQIRAFEQWLRTAGGDDKASIES
jgi:hypothetical protein